MNEQEKKALSDIGQRMKDILNKTKNKSKQGITADFSDIHRDLAGVKRDFQREVGGIEECDPDVMQFGMALREAEALIYESDLSGYL